VPGAGVRDAAGWLGDRFLVDKTLAYAVDPRRCSAPRTISKTPSHPPASPSYAMIRSFGAKLDQLWYLRLVGTDSQPDAFPFARRQLPR
jgi:hypothetical protein